MSTRPGSKFGERSVREQIARGLVRLVGHFRSDLGEVGRVTMTGHSLGGALTLLATCDAPGRARQRHHVCRPAR
jgi:pimeloyl-ACP methyl ester carboxylesterase